MDTETPRPPRSPRGRARLVPVVGLVALLLGGCGDGGISLPTPSGSLSVPSISVSLPSVTRSPSLEPPETEAPTEAPTEEPTQTPETEEPTEQPTETPEPTRTATPRPTRSAVVTQTATASVTETATATPTPTPTETATPTASAAPAATDADDGGVPAWLWWLLAAVLAGLAAFLYLRSRRQQAWDAELDGAQAEVGWLARELLPQLQRSSTPDALAGGWQVSADRVSAAEDRLTGLEASAPDETRAARARSLRDAVRASRIDVEVLLDGRDQAGIPVALATATARLLEALDPGPPDPASPPR
jgi:hypothetical protein